MSKRSLVLLGAALLATQIYAQQISNIMPNNAPAGSPAQTIVINGTFIQYPPTVNWTFGTTTQQLNVNSFDGESQITVTVPASLLTVPGTASIQVFELSSSSNVVNFTITGIALTSLSPNAAQAGGPAFTLTVNGAGFNKGMVVTWNTTQLATTFVSSQQLTAAVPANLIASAGTASVDVLLPGVASPAPLTFTIYAPLTLTSMNPSSALTGSPAITIQVTGSGFTPNTVVTWNGSPLITTYNNATTLLAVIPAGDLTTEGLDQVGVQQDGVPSPATLTFGVGPPPTLTSLSPNSVAVGAPTFILVLYGSDFLAQTVAYWNGAALPTTFVSSTQLIATVSSSLIAQAATVPVTVQTVGRSSNALNFTVGNSALSLTSISPNTTAAGGPAFTLLANGSNFGSSTSITWNGSTLPTTFISANQLSATIPSSLIATAGTANVGVLTPGIPSPPTLPFVITSGLTLTSLSPSSTAAGSASFTLTANGTGFNSGTVLYWGNTPLTTTPVNAGQATATVPASLVTQPASVSITAVNGTLSSNALTFTVTSNGLTLTSISPNSAPSGSPALSMTVTGSGFTSSTVVTWNGSPLNTTFVSAVQLMAAVPASLITTPGTASVDVTSPGQTSPPALTFTVTGGLTLISLSPSSTTAGGPAVSLTVNGTGFNSGTILFWNTTPLATSVLGATQLTATIPANLIALPASASITAENGNLASNALTFTSANGLTITSTSPSSVQAGGPSFTLNVTGTGFTTGTVIFWNGSALSTTFVNANAVTAAVPASLIATSGAATITAQNGSQSSNAVIVSIAGQPAPPAQPITLVSVTPNTAPVGSGNVNITVTGTGFVGPSGTFVTFNGTTLSTTFVSTTQLTAIVPAILLTSPGIAAVSVTGQQPQPPSLPFTITNGLTLTSISPSTVAAGGPDFTLTAIGSGFVSTTTVTWNGSRLATTFVSATQLTATVPTSFITTPGTVSVDVSAVSPQQPPAALPLVITQGLVLTSLSPASAIAGGPAFTLTVNGSGFTAGTTINWNSTPLVTAFVSGTQLTVAVSAALIAQAGTSSITASTGNLVSNALSFPILPPTITSLAPPSAVMGGPAFPLTVNGTNFLPTSAVTWNGASLAVTYVSGTQLTASVTSNLIAKVGTASVVVLNGANASNTATFTITAPPPVITSISPSSVTVGGPAFTMTVAGTGFQSGAVVSLNGAALATTFGSATQVTAAVPASSITQVGSAVVTLANPTGPASNSVVLAIVATPPTITSISPSTAVVGGPAFSMNVIGTGFLSGAAVSWNGTKLNTSFISATQLTAAVTADLIAQAGTAQITAANPNGAASNAVTFTIANPVPTLTSISPSTVTQGGPAFTLTINGTNFVNGAAASLGTTSLTTTFVSSTQLTAAVPATALVRPGPSPVTVTNPGTAASNPLPLTINPPVPTITSIAPTSVTQGGPAFTLTVNGTNFLTGANVFFNSTQLNTTVVSPTQVTAQVTPDLIAQAGTAQITVANMNGSPSIAATLTVNAAAPTLTSIAPVSAKVGDPTFTLALTGTGFVQASIAQWNGAPLATTFVSSTQLTATIDAGRLILPATASVTVVNPGPNGTSLTSNALTFTINPAAAAVISSLSKTSATAGDPAFTLTVTGTGFISSAVVNFGTTALATTFVSATQLTASVPANLLVTPNTTVQVSVAQSGTTSNAIAFTINFPAAPTLRLNPPTGTGPAQQPTLDFGLNSPYPLPLSGTVTLTFASNATVPVDDPAIQFPSGGSTPCTTSPCRTFTFSVPANTTAFPALQISTGTVAGTITLSVTLTAAGVNVTPSSGATASIVIAKSAPVILAGKVNLVHANGYLEVDITGFSTTRDMTQAVFQLNPAPGGSFTSSTITVPLSSLFTTWYQSAASATFGSQFTFTQPFTVIGDTNQIQSVTVTLTNSAGTSVSMTSN
jgi:hypothetical protein